ncbi:MAG: alpha/beta-hydrolase family protein [Actinomycetaceae bacterium]|nr:alpha/beta-hydrolase family protein [Actinomycetaceae bacterium]
MTNIEMDRVGELLVRRILPALKPRSFVGTLIAIVFFVVSMSPSLLPRTWWWQGVVSAILVVGGYTAGAAVGILLQLIKDLAQIRLTADPMWIKWGLRFVTSVAVLWAFWSLTRSYYANVETGRLVGMPPMLPKDYILAITLMIVLVMMTRLVVRIGISVWTIIDTYGRRILPRFVAGGLATLIVVALAVFISSDLIFKGGMEFAYRKAAEINQSEPDGIEQPINPLRSGSPQSLSHWDDIGIYGKEFLSQGPDAREIEDVTGRPAIEPIRVYAGLRKDRDLHQAADLVVAELERTGAFDRSVLVLATTTGTGWLEEWSIQPVEYLTGGDCAIAAMQYTYVPSAIAFIREFDSPLVAGQALYDTVMKAINERPAEKRPAVYLTGVSLGSLGSQAPFANEAQIIEGVDGAVWVGTPYSSPLWQTLTNNRHKGTPQVAPVVSNGHHIRFINRVSHVRTDVYGRELGEWKFPRVVYLQHPSDPVVWWSPRLFNREPDWLREHAGNDVNPSMRWTRGATMVQVMADTPLAGTAPDGHGHTYHRELVPVWKNVLGLVEDGMSGSSPYAHAEPWVTPQIEAHIMTAIEKQLYG